MTDWKIYGQTAWTVAYRKPRANRFKRVDLALSWDQARDLCGHLAALRADVEVWYVTNRQAEIDGYTHTEDAQNVLVDSGKRVAVAEGGTLADFGIAARKPAPSYVYPCGAPVFFRGALAMVTGTEQGSDAYLIDDGYRLWQDVPSANLSPYRVHIIGPNLRDQSKGQFHVHAAGCADVNRDPNYRGPDFATDRATPVEVTSKADVVTYCYADQLDEDPDLTPAGLLSDFHFAPCVVELPEGPDYAADQS